MTRFLRASRVLAAVLVLLGARQGAACNLPLDPYVVAVPAGRSSFDGWIKVPGSKNIDGWMGYIKARAGDDITWKLYWDPTNGGQNMSQLKLVENTQASVRNFPIRYNGGSETKVNLFDLSRANSILLQAMGGKPMEMKEVYGRDPASTGTWADEKYRASAPWEIPEGNYIWNPEPPVKFAPLIHLTGGPSNLSSILPTADFAMRTSSTSPNDRFQFLTDVFGADWNPQPPVGDERKYMQAAGKTPGTAGYFWRLKMDAGSRPQWTGNGGTWTFMAAKGTWKVDTENTADLPGVDRNNPPTNGDGTSMTMPFATPSAPYFYRIKPTGELTFLLEMRGDKYQWTEERVQIDASDNVTPTGTERTLSIEAGGEIKKSGAKYDGGVATAVIVSDEKPQAHVHLKSGSSVTGTVGQKPAGDVEYVVVDESPYGSTSATEFGDLQALALATGNPWDSFNPGNHKADFYYSMPVTDYGLSDLTRLSPTPPGDFNVAQPSANQFPFPAEKWVWFKKAGLVPSDFYKPFKNSSGSEGPAPATVFGNGDQPRYSMVKYTVPIDSNWEKVLSVHHTHISKELPYADARPGPRADAGKGYLKGGEGRLKFFIAPKDALGKAAFTDTSSYDATGDAESAGFDVGKVSANNEIYNNAGAKVAPASATTADFKAAVTGKASTCGAPTCDNSSIGQFGTVTDIANPVRAKMVLLIKDTKYDRTYIVNDQTQGEWRHPQAVAALNSKAVGNTRYPAADNDAAASLVTPGNDPPLIEFKDGGADPNEFGAQVAAGWAPFDLASGRRSGLWVDEDTTLVFRVLSWGNVNWTDQPPANEYEREINDGPKGSTIQEADLPMDSEGRFQYVFRDPNKGPADAIIAQPAYLRVKGPKTLPGNQQREIKVYFHIASNKLKILTLEESRRNK